MSDKPTGIEINCMPRSIGRVADDYRESVLRSDLQVALKQRDEARAERDAALARVTASDRMAAELQAEHDAAMPEIRPCACWEGEQPITVTPGLNIFRRPFAPRWFVSCHRCRTMTDSHPSPAAALAAWNRGEVT